MKKCGLFILALGFALAIPGCGFEGADQAKAIAIEATPTPEPTPKPKKAKKPKATPTPAPVIEQTPSGIKVEKKEGTYYAAADLNLRADCSADAEWVASLTTGTEIKSTGVSENGWIQLVYNEQTCYASGDYVSTEPVAAVAPAQ